MLPEVNDLIRDGLKLPMPTTAAQMNMLRFKCGIRETELDDLMGLPVGTVRKTHDWRTTTVSRREAAFLAGFDAAAQEIADSVDPRRPRIIFHDDREFISIFGAEMGDGTSVARLLYNEAMMRSCYDEAWEYGQMPRLIWFDARTYIDGENLHEWAERHLKRLRVKEDADV